MAFGQPATSSGFIAVTTGASVIPAASVASQLVSGMVTGVQCIAGSAAGTVTLYDGTSTSGVAIFSLAGVPIGTTQAINNSHGIAFSNGLFIVVSGTGTQAIVTYIRD